MKSQRRFDGYVPGGGAVLGSEHPAVLEARTLFPARRSYADPAPLKPGINQRKLGSKVVKGKWRGFPIYTLTLEERATCPPTCLEWRSCMGNRMHWPARHEAGPDLERAIDKHLEHLQWAHPNGFVVRLHILGDFYSLHYVKLWRGWLKRFPALHVFGYTAHRPGSDIGRMILDMPWERFAIRFSGTVGWRGSIVHDGFTENPPDNAVICPAQTGKTDCCGTCGFCWQSTKPVAFARH